MADTDEGEGGGEAQAAAAAAKKKKMMLIIIVAAVLLLGGIGGGLYLFVFSGGDAAQAEDGGHGAKDDGHGAKDDGHGAKDAHGEAAKDGHGGGDGHSSGGVAYFDMPEILVNIQGADGSSAYLKLAVSLEVGSDGDKAGLEEVQPRITDQLQSYLRELRTDDLKGSAGVMRVKEEMLRRIKVAAAPIKVKDVLLKEMVVQ